MEFEKIGEFFERKLRTDGKGYESSFSNRLRELRAKKNKPQEGVSNDLNLAKATYGTYENARYLPDAATVAKMSEYFNVSADYLLGESDNPKTKNNVSLLETNLSKKCIDCLLDISRSKIQTRTLEAVICSKHFEEFLVYLNTYLLFSAKFDRETKAEYKDAHDRATKIDVSTNEYLSVDAYPSGGIKISDIYFSLMQESFRDILKDIESNYSEQYKKEMLRIVSEESAKS